jgi:hypothetical protein
MVRKIVLLCQYLDVDSLEDLNLLGNSNLVEKQHKLYRKKEAQNVIVTSSTIISELTNNTTCDQTDEIHKADSTTTDPKTLDKLLGIGT